MAGRGSRGGLAHGALLGMTIGKTVRIYRSAADPSSKTKRGQTP
ncbi:hypothetical protein X805_18750 [Sphaerotilus natans subsp. natans DSM 6575]|uniref:Uncharacterized protein n=1 Tax=Sphaerotilus natans subsp. natans DSM 6575 TaxID=1286631 RepID=A0A059KN88_9BURK|nr:hypothetical protein X805_18750 [Sphaerotilus natans subsp. natans DSM 6575]